MGISVRREDAGEESAFRMILRAVVTRYDVAKNVNTSIDDGFNFIPSVSRQKTWFSIELA